MDFITSFARTWGHIVVGIGIIGIVFVFSHQFITWFREINDINKQIRRNDG
jgi:hypothetical protein